MTMTIRPGIKPRERIMVMGPAGSGKSNAGLSIARKVTDATFWFFDTDDSIERLMATDFTDVQDRGNYEIWNMPDWDTLISGMKIAVEKGTPDDWLAVDSITPTWQSVQDAFIDEIFQKSSAAFFIEARKALVGVKGKDGKEPKNLSAFDGWKDWSVINKMYAEMYNLLYRFPGHKFVTAEQASIGGDDDKDTLGMFGAIGSKPGGQKRLGHIPSTIIQMGHRKGEWHMTTVKDRGRPEMERVLVEDFAVDYLMGVAGWKMTKV